MDARMAVISITATEARSVVKDSNPSNVEDRLVACFRAARKGFMAPSDDEAFKAGLAAAIELTEDESEKDRIRRSAKALGRISSLLAALQAGLPVDVEAMAAEKRDEDLLPLNPLWLKSAQPAQEQEGA